MIEDMQSGECRWIGREDIHVYCHAPAGREPRYCVVCPEGGMEHGNWMTADEAGLTVSRILTGTVPAAA